MRIIVKGLSIRIAAVIFTVIVVAIAPWQSMAASVEDIAMMKSADRQKVLVEGAKKEGKIMWYTTLIVDQVVRPVKEAFEKEYPFIQVEFYRGNAENLVRRMLDLTIAGEIPIALHIFNHHAYISKTAGAPVDWYGIEPVTATIQTMALAKSTPHPHAAMLLLDFVLSEKGQRVFQQSNYLPSHPKVPAKQADLKPGGGRFKKALYMTPDIQFAKGNEWVDYFQNQFLK